MTHREWVEHSNEQWRKFMDSRRSVETKNRELSGLLQKKS